ncbi:MAG TPA: ABC transporter ATP-binding protein [Rhizobiaceae bacterium]|nr:ABC transporter ATP-binding protein [Rhizobiaceae bacterium]
MSSAGDHAASLSLTGVSKAFQRQQPLSERIVERIAGKAQRHDLWAVRDVSLTVEKHEVVALVGESGCGKSTVGRLACGILKPSAGTIEIRMSGPERRSRKELEVQMIFQNPLDSLNPSHRVRDIIGEPALAHGLIDRRGVAAYVAGLMSEVGLDPSLATRRPHELSGGQCQRVGIARALAVKPSVLVCDEPTSALDVSVQAQIMRLFRRLRADQGTTYLFISHDLALVRLFSDRVAVMYLGRIVEVAKTSDIFSRPSHPYSVALLAAAPRLDQRRQRFTPLEGEVPSPLAPPSGCPFHTRCKHVMPRCRGEVPRLRQVAPDHWAACHLNFELE